MIKRQSKALKRTWRVLAYAISLMQATRRLQPFFVDLEIDDAPRWSAAVYQVSVGNGAITAADWRRTSSITRPISLSV